MLTVLRLKIIKILLLTVQVLSSAPVQVERNDSGFGYNDTVIIGRESSNDSDPIPESIMDKIIGFVVKFILDVLLIAALLALAVAWLSIPLLCEQACVYICAQKASIADDEDHKTVVNSDFAADSIFSEVERSGRVFYNTSQSHSR